MKRTLKTALVIALTATIGATAASAQVGKLPGDVVKNGQLVAASTTTTKQDSRQAVPTYGTIKKQQHRFGAAKDTQNPYSRSFGLGQ